MTVVGLHDFVKVSISAEFVSCFADYMHRRAGVGNFSFLRFLRVDPGRHLFSESEKNVALFISFWIFYTLLVSLHAASRAPCSCHSVSSWDRSSNFGALGLRWWGSPWHINPSEGFWSRMSAWRATAFSNFTHWIGFRMFEPFRKIDSRLRRHHLLKYATQLSCTFQHSHCTFVTILFRPCQAVLQPGDAHESTFHQICNHSQTCRTSILDGATFHRMNWCTLLWSHSCKAIKTFYHWDSRRISHSAAWKNSETDSVVIFARLLISWRKLQVSPLEHCP